MLERGLYVTLYVGDRIGRVIVVMVGALTARLDAVSMAVWEPRGPRRVSVGGSVVTL
jgi:hypothetical protein